MQVGKTPIDPSLLEHVYLQRMTMCEKERSLYPERSFMELMCGKDRREEWTRSRSLLAFESWDKKDGDGILGAAFRVLSSLSEDGKGYRGLLYYESMLRHSGGRIAAAFRAIRAYAATAATTAPVMIAPDFFGEKLNSSDEWDMDSKPTKAHGARNTMVNTPEAGLLPGAKAGFSVAKPP